MGAWIEMVFSSVWTAMTKSPPVWGRGLKCVASRMGAWIEIFSVSVAPMPVKSSPPVWGAWIEIVIADFASVCVFCRLPYGGRGLKWLYVPVPH